MGMCIAVLLLVVVLGAGLVMGRVVRGCRGAGGTHAPGAQVHCCPDRPVPNMALLPWNFGIDAFAAIGVRLWGPASPYQRSAAL